MDNKIKFDKPTRIIRQRLRESELLDETEVSQMVIGIVEDNKVRVDVLFADAVQDPMTHLLYSNQTRIEEILNMEITFMEMRKLFVTEAIAAKDHL